MVLEFEQNTCATRLQKQELSKWVDTDGGNLISSRSPWVLSRSLFDPASVFWTGLQDVHDKEIGFILSKSASIQDVADIATDEH